MATYVAQQFAEEVSGSMDSLNVNCSYYITPANLIQGAIADLTGGYRRLGRIIVFIPPRRHPAWPWCRVSSFKIKPFEELQYSSNAVVTGAAGFDRIILPRAANFGAIGKCELDVVFSKPDKPESSFPQQGGGGGDQNQEMELATQSWEFAGRNFTVAQKYYKFEFSGDGPQTEDNQVQFIVPEVHVEMTRHMCLAPPKDSILQCGGKINKVAVRLGPFNWPKETVRFESCSASQKITTGQGLPFWDITYKFAILAMWGKCISAPGSSDDGRPITTMDWVGWNRVFNPAKGAWERKLNKTTNDPIHRFADDDCSLTYKNTNLVGFPVLFHPAAT